MILSIEMLDKERLELNKVLVNKTAYGQYLTPVSVAKFMASLFDESKLIKPRLLDAGAGIGTLSAAVLERLTADCLSSNASCTLIEIDELLEERIASSLSSYQSKLDLDVSVIKRDFIEWGCEQINNQGSLFVDPATEQFTHIILNPPYKKMNSNSMHRKLLRDVGIETVNLYTAFVALSIQLLKPGGQLIAIIPRSFCNGPYYRPFRELLMKEAAILHIHLFDSRNKAFKDDDVLQENVIIKLERGAEQGDVNISTSTDDRFEDYSEAFYPFTSIVRENDTEKFIFIPTKESISGTESYSFLSNTLKDLGISVSTGPVVGFRVKKHLRMMPGEGTVPLLYPIHIEREGIKWVKEGKKPNAIVKHSDTEKWLYPNGNYVVIRRFSSKEEKKRIFSAVTHPESFKSDLLGFDNGLNVLHMNKKGLEKELAYGLHVFMNSTLFDNYFRMFSWHTQVNATDLRSMFFPPIDVLMELGVWYLSLSNPAEQALIDGKVEEVLS